MHVLIWVTLALLGVSAIPAETAAPDPFDFYPNCWVVDGELHVSVPSSTGTRLVVERSRNDGPFYWRAKFDPDEANRLFIDEIPEGSDYVYRVRNTAPGTYVEFASCASVDLGGDLQPPLSCQVVEHPFGFYIEADLGDQLYARTVLLRSVNGGATYWRSLMGNPNVINIATGYDGSAFWGNRIQYFVQAVALDGRRSEYLPCGAEVHFDPVPPTPICSRHELSSAHEFAVGLDQEQVPFQLGTRAIVRRSVDGGPVFWRGERSNPYPPGYAFREGLLTPGRAYEYFIEVEGPTGIRSERVSCGTYTPPAYPPPIGPEGCTFEVTGDQAFVRWGPILRVDHVVYRRLGDNPLYWRSLVTPDRVGITDPIPTWFDSNGDIHYEVVAVNSNGRSDPTTCHRL